MENIGRIPSSVEEVPERREGYRIAREKLNETLASVREQLRSNPWMSAGAGFGAGMLIGALVVLAARRRF